MSILLNIILGNPKKNKYESIYLICNNLDECNNQIILTIINILKSYDYKFVIDYEEYKQQFYESIFFDNEVFDYSIFSDNKWSIPWTHQEIYNSIYNIKNKNIENSLENLNLDNSLENINLKNFIENLDLDNSLENLENSIPLNIILTNTNLEGKKKYKSIYLVCTNLDDCYNKIIITIKNMLELYKHDYPDNYEEYKNIIWYKYNSFDNEIFDYSIFIKNKWLKIWTHQEIYESICDIIYNLDLQNSIYNKRNSYDYESNSDSDTSEH